MAGDELRARRGADERAKEWGSLRSAFIQFLRNAEAYVDAVDAESDRELQPGDAEGPAILHARRALHDDLDNVVLPLVRLVSDARSRGDAHLYLEIRPTERERSEDVDLALLRPLRGELDEAAHVLVMLRRALASEANRTELDTALGKVERSRRLAEALDGQ